MWTLLTLLMIATIVPVRLCAGGATLDRLVYDARVGSGAGPDVVWVAQTRGWRAADYLGWIVPKPRDVVVPFAVIVALALAGSALQRSGYCGPAPQSFA